MWGGHWYIGCGGLTGWCVGGFLVCNVSGWHRSVISQCSNVMTGNFGGVNSRLTFDVDGIEGVNAALLL